MPLPVVTVEGRAVADPELRFTPQGLALASLRIVASDRKLNEQSGKWEDTRTLWLKVSCWRTLAENVAETVRKGDLVMCVGKLQTEEWEKDGEKRSMITMTAFTVAPSLQFASFSRNASERTSGGAAADDPWASGPPPEVKDEEPPF